MCVCCLFCVTSELILRACTSLMFRYELQGTDQNVLVVYPHEAADPVGVAGEYTCVVNNGYQLEQRSANLLTPIAPPAETTPNTSSSTASPTTTERKKTCYSIVCWLWV